MAPDIEIPGRSPVTGLKKATLNKNLLAQKLAAERIGSLQNLKRKPILSTSITVAASSTISMACATDKNTAQKLTTSDNITWKSCSKALEDGKSLPQEILKPQEAQKPTTDLPTAQATTKKKNASAVTAETKPVQPAEQQVTNPTSVFGRVRHTDKVYPAHEYYEGVIFSAPHHTHHYNQDLEEPQTRDQSMTRIGMTNSKYRKFVVVRRCYRHVIALPIMTHEGKGLKNIPERSKDEFVSIREAAFSESAAPAESSHPVLWSTLHPAMKFESMWHANSDVTSVHFTFPYSHKLNTKCTISGELLPRSREELLALYASVCGAIPKLLPPLSQSRYEPYPSSRSKASNSSVAYSNQASTIGPNRLRPRQPIDCGSSTSSIAGRL